MSELDEVIEEIWAEHDKDNSGALDKEEAKNVVVEVLGQAMPDTDL